MENTYSNRKLIRNAIRTPDGTVIESCTRHDYVTYTDANGKEYMIDGGLDYVRSSAHKDQTSLALYDDEPHEVQRKIIKWGTYGIDGKQPLQFKPIADMDTDHIKSVLRKVNFISPVIKDCMLVEIEERNNV